MRGRPGAGQRSGSGSARRRPPGAPAPCPGGAPAAPTAPRLSHRSPGPRPPHEQERSVRRSREPGGSRSPRGRSRAGESPGCSARPPGRRRGPRPPLGSGGQPGGGGCGAGPRPRGPGPAPPRQPPRPGRSLQQPKLGPRGHRAPAGRRRRCRAGRGGARTGQPLPVPAAPCCPAVPGLPRAAARHLQPLPARPRPKPLRRLLLAAPHPPPPPLLPSGLCPPPPRSRHPPVGSLRCSPEVCEMRPCLAEDGTTGPALLPTLVPGPAQLWPQLGQPRTPNCCWVFASLPTPGPAMGPEACAWQGQSLSI